MEEAEQIELRARIKALCRPLKLGPSVIPPRIGPLAGVRAVLFDIYGTVFLNGRAEREPLALELDAAYMGAALAGAGFRLPNSQAARQAVLLFREAIAAEHAAGRARGIERPEVDIVAIWRAVAAELVRAGLADGPADEWTLKRLAIEYECRANPVWPAPGARDALRYGKSSGRLLGLISNAQFYTAIQIAVLFGGELDELGFDPSLCIWSYQHKMAKPTPGLLRMALDDLAARGIAAPQVVVIGNDPLNDIRPARRQGCRTILCAIDPGACRADLPGFDPAEPDAIMTDWAQLPAILP